MRHASTNRTRADPRKNLVGFSIGGVNYAIGVSEVRQIINPLALTRLPQLQHPITGVAEHRGEVVPVVDLRTYYGAPVEDTRRTKWILMDIDGRLLGIIVDAVIGVFGTPDDRLRPVPLAADGFAKPGIAGVASHEGSMVFVLDRALFADLARPALDPGALPEADSLPVLDG